MPTTTCDETPAQRGEDLIFTAEACEITGFHPSTFSRYVKDGTITPATKGPGVRGAFLFRRSDVQALAAAKRDAA
jgi:predicted site-specific integrase-resolvase